MTAEDRPTCKTGCGKNAVLSRGELAYKGFCSGCYKADVAARRAARNGGTVEPEGPGAVPPVGDGGAGPEVLPPGEGAADDDGGDHGPDDEADARPRGRRRSPVSCGWCIDGNHHPRPDEPDREDELGNHVRGRAGTLGCAAAQVFLTGPMEGLPKGLRCDCHAAGHDRSAMAGAE